MVLQPAISDIPEDVQRTIQTRLDEIERDMSIRIVLAVTTTSDSSLCGSI
jgi:hypothetical protein